ncbi:hypothetical protein [Mucilaginibacter ginsenosidivorans]|uniref:Uncharacterized protein n=1 Tax=Mucilaginibacter ginsenosidivorans TaxID=398053 RepID=A0A5B8UUP7_9SPHI|nr:hypothetical protein [Mucilaginibacter ginsenosidivorans]QEC62495.1 hypothetical protein FRZ54_07805 [Mucilaginibacter ginsenosidivorans]
MKTFDLELRVTAFGSIITWKIYLEDATDENQKVTGWQSSPDGYLYKKLPGYQIEDVSLEVFAGCHGITGGTLSCEVFINSTKQVKTVDAKVEDKKYATQSYPI